MSRREKPAGPAQRRITVLPARVVPLPAEEERQAVHALAALLAADLDRRAATDKTPGSRSRPTGCCECRPALTSRQRRGVLPTTAGHRCPRHAGTGPDAGCGADDTGTEEDRTR